MTRWDEYKICKRCGAILPKNSRCDHKKAAAKEIQVPFKWKNAPAMKPREPLTGTVATYSEEEGLKIEYHGKYGKIIGGKTAGSVYCIRCRRYTVNANGWWIRTRSSEERRTGKRIFICNRCWSPKSTF